MWSIYILNNNIWTIFTHPLSLCSLSVDNQRNVFTKCAVNIADNNPGGKQIPNLKEGGEEIIKINNWANWSRGGAEWSIDE